MDFLLLASFCILGALIASFAGVVAARLNTGQAIACGRSLCDACGRPLGALALVPILSYLAGGGRAHCCRARISPLSTMGEIVLAVLFALSYYTLGPTLLLALFLLILSLLYTLVLYDLAHTILPPVLLAPLLVLALIYSYLAAPDTHALLSSVAFALFVGAFFLALHAFSGGRAMGLADAPLAFALAMLAGPRALSGLAFSFWIGAVVGIVILLRTPRGSRIGIEVPFAPFLAAGFLLAFFTPWDPFALITGLS